MNKAQKPIFCEQIKLKIETERIESGWNTMR